MRKIIPSAGISGEGRVRVLVIYPFTPLVLVAAPEAASSQPLAKSSSASPHSHVLQSAPYADHRCSPPPVHQTPQSDPRPSIQPSPPANPPPYPSHPRPFHAPTHETAPRAAAAAHSGSSPQYDCGEFFHRESTAPPRTTPYSTESQNRSPAPR